MSGVLLRAEGCLLGQLAGDALGSLVEFEPANEIRKQYPNRVTELVDGGCWETIAGQPTDDSELALALTHSLIQCGGFNMGDVRESYQRWYRSNPFDCGNTTSKGIRGLPDHRSQANGALMRASPLGIYGTRLPLGGAAKLARLDASITHPHIVCGDINALYAQAIAVAISVPTKPKDLYEQILAWSEVNPDVQKVTQDAATTRPVSYQDYMGWVLIAWQNALYQLLHAPNMSEGVIDTVMQGGDTNTNAAICGALLGAVHGADAGAAQWDETIRKCTPQKGDPRVRRPRPNEYWPNNYKELAAALLKL